VVLFAADAVLVPVVVVVTAPAVVDVVEPLPPVPGGVVLPAPDGLVPPVAPAVVDDEAVLLGAVATGSDDEHPGAASVSRSAAPPRRRDRGRMVSPCR
jgi:hypothetical protein